MRRLKRWWRELALDCLAGMIECMDQDSHEFQTWTLALALVRTNGASARHIWKLGRQARAVVRAQQRSRWGEFEL